MEQNSVGDAGLLMNGQTLPVQVSCGGAPASCGAPSSYSAPQLVYAIGRIEARFPGLGAEKEFAQATGRTGTDGLSDRQAFHNVISKTEHRYLTRQLCWVFRVEGIDTYMVVPRNPADFDLLVESVRPRPRPTDVDVAIGIKGPSRHRRSAMA